MCSFVIVTLDHLKLLKSAVSDHPQTDPFQSNSKVSVDPMGVLDSLMPCIHNHWKPQQVMAIVLPTCGPKKSRDICIPQAYSPMFASLDLIRNTCWVKLEIQEHFRLVISQDQQVRLQSCVCHVVDQYATNIKNWGGGGGRGLPACIKHVSFT